MPDSARQRFALRDWTGHRNTTQGALIPNCSHGRASHGRTSLIPASPGGTRPGATPQGKVVIINLFSAWRGLSDRGISGPDRALRVSARIALIQNRSRGMAKPGLTGQGGARRGRARRGQARLDRTGHGMTRQGSQSYRIVHAAGRGPTWHGRTRRDFAGLGDTRQDEDRNHNFSRRGRA